MSEGHEEPCTECSRCWLVQSGATRRAVVLRFWSPSTAVECRAHDRGQSSGKKTVRESILEYDCGLSGAGCYALRENQSAGSTYVDMPLPSLFRPARD